MSSNVFDVDHERRQYPYMSTQTIDHNASYCLGMVEKIEYVTRRGRASERHTGMVTRNIVAACD